MIKACPNRHLSLAAYRLHVFRDLWNVDKVYASNPCTLRTTGIGQESVRWLHATASRQKHGRSHNGPKNTRRHLDRVYKAAKARRLRSKQNNEAYNVAPIVSHDTEDSRFADALKPISTIDQRSSDSPSTVAGDVQTTPNPWRTNTDDGRWSPYTKSGREDLKSMVQELEHLTGRAASQPRTLHERGKEAAAAGLGSIKFPIRSFDSPIQHYIARSEVKKQRKTRLTFDEQDPRLSNNPWAQMLSTPVRLDQSTKSRLPRALMSSWGMAQDPQSSKNYIVPLEASDLQDLRDRIDNTQTPGAGDRSERPGRYRKQLDGESILMQPNSVLMKAMTGTFVRKTPGGRGKTHTAGPLLMATITPFKWREAISKAETYRRARGSVQSSAKAEQVGEEHDEGFPNLYQLEWQPDVPTRLRGILARRVLIALEGLSKHNSSNLSIRSKRVYAMDVPADGQLILDAQALVTKTESSAESGSKVEAVDETRIPLWHPGSFFLHIGSPQQYLKSAETWRLADVACMHNSSAQDYMPSLPDNPYLPPMISVASSLSQTSPSNVRLPVFNLLTLLGPAFIEDVQKVIKNHKVLDQGFWTSYDAKRKSLLGSKVSLKTGDQQQDVAKHRHLDSGSHVAVDKPGREESDLDMEMTAFLEEQSRLHEEQARQDLNEVSQQSSDLVSTGTVNTNTKPMTQFLKEHDTEKEYLILVKSNAVKSQDLVTELWQLWRYIGGRDGLLRGSDDASTGSDMVAIADADGAGDGDDLIENADSESNSTNPPVVTKVKKHRKSDRSASPAR